MKEVFEMIRKEIEGLNHDVYSKREVEDILAKLGEYVDEEYTKADEDPISTVVRAAEEVYHEIRTTIDNECRRAIKSMDFEDQVDLDLDHREIKVDLDMQSISEQIIDEVMDHLPSESAFRDLIDEKL